ncbi:MAG TPA: sialidase family protein, partial [Actinomycetota bacterium]
MKKVLLPVVAVGLAALAAILSSGSATADVTLAPRVFKTSGAAGPEISGAVEFKDVQLGTGITECPQAGSPADQQPKPLDRRTKERVEQVSNGGDDRRANDPEYSCFPQNETSIDVNPTNLKNAVGGANDYRLGWGTSGVYSTTDNGNHWYTAIIPFPSLPSGDNLDGGGDPAIAFDRAGIVYYAEINFNRTDDVNGIFVSRSTNGGFTWTRACVPINVGTPQDDQARCGGAGDPRLPGDGVVVFQPENDPTPPNGSSANFSVTFHDKEWLTVGPRPAGVQPTCFAPETKTPIPAGSPTCPQSVIGVDRVYVTWTAFNNPSGAPGAITSSTIEFSYSDDQGRSWSPRKTINGSAPFCVFAVASVNGCDDNQFSVPTVNPTNGHLWVAFENFNTPDENQILVVRSRDGGQTFEGPFHVTPQFDVNMRLRSDCVARGAGRVHLTNSCFRIPGTLAIVADRRGGAFADDLYLVMFDNRNGTRDNTNTDVFFFKSVDGGTTWIGPTRVNDDPSAQPANRNCGRGGQPACPPPAVTTGNDQFWPWVDINERGDLNVGFHDRRLDTDSVAHEWPTSRVRPGNYLVWYWAAQCDVTQSNATACVAPTAAPIPQPTAPVNPGNELFPEQRVFPFANFVVSDVPSNFDYSFRAGIFAGDYTQIAVADKDNTVWGLFTDARNGRSS